MWNRAKKFEEKVRELIEPPHFILNTSEVEAWIKRDSVLYPKKMKKPKPEWRRKKSNEEKEAEELHG